MNELTTVPPTQTKNINLLTIFIMFLVLRSTGHNRNLIGSNSNGTFFNININKKTFDKIDQMISISKKIGPYLPEPVVDVLNNFIPVFEKLNRIVGLIDFLTNHGPFNPIVPVKNLDSKERFNNLITLLKEELPTDKMKVLSPVLELVSNIDKYKVMLDMLKNISKSSNETEKNNIENMLDTIMPLIGGNDEKAKDKMKEMVQMMEILKLLNSDDKGETELSK